MATEKRILDNMANNLVKCCDHTVSQVLLYLSEEDRRYVQDLMKKIKNT